MILLDTNIISELMKVRPSTQVIAWLDQQKSIHLFLSTITIAEISYGINNLPKGKRRKQLETALMQTIAVSFKHRILDFDLAAAYAYGNIMVQRRKAGKPLSIPDGQIAAIAYAQEFILATRNERDFIKCGLQIVNPFNILS